MLPLLMFNVLAETLKDNLKGLMNLPNSQSDSSSSVYFVNFNQDCTLNIWRKRSTTNGIVNLLCFLIALPSCLSCEFYHKHELKDNCGGCGICQRVYENQETYDCSWKFLTYFFKGKVCKVRSLCGKGKGECPRDLQCVSMIGTHRCVCDSATYGRLCEFSYTPGVPRGDYAVVQDIIFTPIIFADKYASVSIFLNNVGRNLEVRLVSPYYTLYFSSEICKRESTDSYCKKWYSDFPTVCESRTELRDSACVMTINFVPPPFSVSDQDVILHVEKQISAEILAFRVLFQIEISNKFEGSSEALIFKTDGFWFSILNLIHGPNMHGCRPSLDLMNVAVSSFSPSEFSRSDEIVITGSYELSCEVTDNILQSWLAWKVDVNHNEVTDKHITEVLNQNNLRFKPFSLDFGFYKVKYKVSVYNGNNQSMQFMYGYFKIVHLNLEPLISGGAERAVFFNITSLTLDGSLSKDPNVSPSEQISSLEFRWSCDKEIPLCKERVSDQSITYPGPFQKNQVFTFKLTIVSKVNRKYEASTFQKIFLTENDLAVICRKNCGDSKFESNPGVVLYLEANTDSSDALVWFYRKGTESKFHSVKEIQQAYTPNHVLIVLKNALEEGQSYSFQIKFENKNVAFANFDIRIAKKVDEFNCKIIVNGDKTVITRGMTEVKVSCKHMSYQKVPPIYSFYDKYPNRNDTGRLLASDRSNTTGFVNLTRGKVVAEVTNEHGMIGITEVLVDLQDERDYTTFIEDKLKHLKKAGPTLDAYFRTNTMSVILDLIKLGKHNLTASSVSDIIEEFLQVASRDVISNIPVLKVWVSLVSNLIASDFTDNLTTTSINYMSKAVRNLSYKLLEEVRGNQTQAPELCIIDVYKLCQHLLSICNAIYKSSKDDVSKYRGKRKELRKLRFFYREISEFLVSSVGWIMLSVSLITLPYEAPLIMNEKYIQVWVKEDTPNAFRGIEPVPSVNISERLSKSMKRSSKFIILHIAEYDGDPYFYMKDFEISTNVVDLRVQFKEGNKVPHIRNVSQPIVIKLNHFYKQKAIVSGSVQQPVDPSQSKEALELADMRVAVHQLRVPQTGSLDLNFLNLKEGQAFKVTVSFNFRPDYDFVFLKGADVNKSFPLYRHDVKDPNSYDVFDLYYLGILPGPQILPNEFANYTFEISTQHCVSWKVFEWDTTGCKIDDAVSKNQELHCRCEHLSTFAGFSQVPINSIDLFQDYKLFLDIHKNPFVAIFVICILILYFILLFWALMKDSKDALKGCAIYLEDNFPDDEFVYLVAVYTGNKFFSGTTSNVGLIVEGDHSCSRPHILKSILYRTLQRGDDNWFLMCAPNYLGNIQLIHLWMDYRGKSPEWYCSKIVVVDIHTNKHYYFLIDSWLSLRKEYYIERFVKPSKASDDNRLVLAVDNMVYGFRETHLWLSILSRHPRSSVSRAQRLSVAVSGLLVMMLVSCMFYGVLDESVEDLPKYQVGLQELIIGFTAMLISSILINLVISSFRRTLVFVQYEDAEVVDDSEIPNEPKSRSHSKKASKDKNCFMRLIESAFGAFIKRKRFMPVFIRIATGKKPTKQKRCDICWNIFSWTTCIIVTVVSSFFIILYSLKFGKVKSLEWLSCVTLSLIQVLFVTAPLKIMAIAAISGVLASNMYEVVSHHITPEELIKYKETYLGFKPDVVAKVVSDRTQSIYIPLGYVQLVKKLHRQRQKDAAWVLLDSALLGLFIVLICLQNQTLWTTKYYWNNQQLMSILRKGYREEGIQLYELQSLSLYSELMENKILPVIFQRTWYNGLPILEKGLKGDSRFVFGGTCQLFGLPRLRQLRLKPGLCKESKVENLPPLCDVTLTSGTLDMDIYADGWKSVGLYEDFVKLSAWSYLNNTETDEDTLFGYSSLAYHGGGYVADLATSEEKSEDIVLYLRRELWMDNLTSVVFFEFTVFNAFTGAFSWLISVTENLHTGMLMNTIYVVSVSLDVSLTLLDALVVVSLVMFSVRVFFNINRNGFVKAAYNFWNISEILIISLAIFAVFLFTKSIGTKSEYLETYRSYEREVFFGFVNLMKYLDEFRLVLVVLVILLVVRFFKVWTVSKTCDIFFRTLLSDWSQIMWIFSYLSLVLYLHWRIVLYLMNIFLLSKNNFVIVSKIDFKQFVKNCNTISCEFDPFVLCSVSHIAKLLVIVYFFTKHRVVKRKCDDKDYINICTVFCKKPNEYNLLLECERSKKSVLKLT